MPYFKIVAETNENTVVTTYEPLPKLPEDSKSYGISKDRPYYTR